MLKLLILQIVITFFFYSVNAQNNCSNFDNKETYIFLRKGYLIRKHNDLCIQVEKHNEKYYVVANYKDKKQKQIFNDTLFISQNEWNILENHINDIDFFNLKEIDDPNIIVFDATCWILKGRKENLSNSITTYLGHQSIIEDICRYMIKLSKLKLKGNEVY